MTDTELVFQNKAMDSAVVSTSPSQSTKQDRSLAAPLRETNPEIQKLHELRQKVLDKEIKKHSSFWSGKRRQQLEEITLRMLVFSIIAGVVLGLITTFWLHHFTVVKNVFSITVLDSKGSQRNETVQSSFVGDIKNVEDAINSYMFGVLLLVEGGILANVARLSTFKIRPWWYLGAIFAYAASIAFIVVAPLTALGAGNSPNETQQLNSDAYQAYKRNIKGSIKYFRSHQCENIEKFSKGKEQLQRQRMEYFCKMLAHLICFLHFIWFTAVIPVASFLVCCLEVIVNRKSWAVKAVRWYKIAKPNPKKQQRESGAGAKGPDETIV